jgi:hypothetical protein
MHAVILRGSPGASQIPRCLELRGSRRLHWDTPARSAHASGPGRSDTKHQMLLAWLQPSGPDRGKQPVWGAAHALRVAAACSHMLLEVEHCCEYDVSRMHARSRESLSMLLAWLLCAAGQIQA